MSSVKVAITLDQETLIRVDGLVSKSIFPNRSRAIQAAVSEKLERMGRGRARCDRRWHRRAERADAWPSHRPRW